MNDYISRLKSKPLPARRRIAMITAGATTGLVAVVWLTASIALGTFSSATAKVAETPASGVSNANLIGAAAASQQDAAAAPDNTPAGLTIVQTRSSSTLAPSPSDQTIIPF